MATAYLASLAFATAFLLASLFGADGLTALYRGIVVALCATIIGGPMIRLVVGTVLAAMARDRAEQAAMAEAEDQR